jgi:molybdopterin-containing oxidoreductase family molybdopterin binding subunit
MISDKDKIVSGDDVWIPTVCAGCYNCCGILAHRVNGEVVEIKGDPNADNSNGKICAKGLVRSMDLKHPSRVRRPLMRTNPEKGVGVDPKWKEISEEEALNRITEKLKKIKAEDPRKLILSHFDISGYRLSAAFGLSYGTVNMHWNRADYCGSASHPAWLITNGTLNSEVDLDYCKYVVIWGTQLGHVVNTIALLAAPHLADARREGAKLVVVDPFCSYAASKADEWLAIKPGTDGALALAMLKVMVHELGIYDSEFIRKKTNGVYLVKPDGFYLRDKESGKPLVFDESDNTFKCYDDPALSAPAMEGSFEHGESSCKPAFQALKEHLATIDVEEMADVCTIPADRIRKITRDFAQAASIGSTIRIDGHELPYRPAGIDYKKGAASHKGGLNSCFAIHLLNLLVGAVDVPGGQRGVNPKGPYWSAETGPDGLLVPSDIITKYNKPYPGRKAKTPEILDLQELFPAALFTRGLYPMGIDNPEQFGIPYKPEMLIHGRSNLMMNSHNRSEMAETLQKIDFQVSICMFIDETAEFADIILPDAHDLERWDLFPANDPYAFIVPGPGKWYWLMRQPVVEPPEQARPWTEWYLEFAKRLGLLPKLYEVGNQIWNLSEEDRLDPQQTYTIRDIAERQAKRILGEAFSWETYRKQSSIVSREKTVDEAYPSMFFESRMPIYLEYLLGHAGDVKQVVSELGIPWDFRPYSPVPVWIPCEAQQEDGEFDLVSTNCKLPTHQFSVTSENLWIDEIAVRSPYSYNIMLHTSKAREKGLKTGDLVAVESKYGKLVGRLKVTEIVHPDCVNICGTFGHWAEKMPISKGKGVSYNDLLPAPSLAHMDRIDMLSGQLDQCAKVKIYKVEQ